MSRPTPEERAAILRAYEARSDRPTMRQLCDALRRPSEPPPELSGARAAYESLAAQSIPGGTVPPEYEPEEPNPQPAPVKTGDTE